MNSAAIDAVMFLSRFLFMIVFSDEMIVFSEWDFAIVVVVKSCFRQQGQRYFLKDVVKPVSAVVKRQYSQCLLSVIGFY